MGYRLQNKHKIVSLMTWIAGKNKILYIYNLNLSTTDMHEHQEWCLKKMEPQDK